MASHFGVGRRAFVTRQERHPNFSGFLSDPAVRLFAVDVASFAVVTGYGAPQILELRGAE